MPRDAEQMVAWEWPTKGTQLHDVCLICARPLGKEHGAGPVWKSNDGSDSVKTMKGTR